MNVLVNYGFHNGLQVNLMPLLVLSGRHECHYLFMAIMLAL